MFSQPVPSSSQSTFPAWCMANPDVDRSAPPRPGKKKGAKKMVTKTPAKKR